MWLINSMVFISVWFAGSNLYSWSLHGLLLDKFWFVYVIIKVDYVLNCCIMFRCFYREIIKDSTFLYISSLTWSTKAIPVRIHALHRMLTHQQDNVLSLLKLLRSIGSRQLRCELGVHTLYSTPIAKCRKQRALLSSRNLTLMPNLPLTNKLFQFNVFVMNHYKWASIFNLISSPDILAR